MKNTSARASVIKVTRSMLLYLIIDVCLFYAAFIIAFLMDRLNLHTSDNATFGVVMLLAMLCGITTIIFMYAGRIYNVLWNYAGVTDLLRVLVVAGASLGFGMLYRGLFALVSKHWAANPFGVTSVHVNLVVVAYFMFFFLALGVRMIKKILIAAKIKRVAKNPLNRTIIFGAGSMGAATIKRMMSHQEDGYLPVACIDDMPEKMDMMIEGVRVLGGRENLGHAIKEYKADVIAICISNISKRELRVLYDYVKQYDVRIMMANVMRDANNALNSDIVSIKSIEIGDLLRRDEHTVDRELVDGMVKNKVVMVTGGAGSIGSELCRQALSYGCKKLVIFDHSENGMFELNEELRKIYPDELGVRYFLEMGSVRDRNKLREIMTRHKPQIVFHAAAYKHVPMMEVSADEAIKNNIFGTKNVIEQCDESGVKKFILISTDKAINPANVMGATKRCAELCLQKLSSTTKTQLAAVRFGNVLASSGSVIPTFLKQINEGGPVTVTHKDMKRYFMTIPEAVRLVLQAGALAKGGEVFVLDMGEPVRIYDLACDLIRMAGMTPNKDIGIAITGLRPGEKLFEELQYGNENTNTTKHKDIFVCKLAPVNKEQVEESLEKMWEAASAGDKITSEKLLFELVPSEYREKKASGK